VSAQKIRVKRAEIDPVPFEVLEQEILGIAEGMRRINATRVSRRAVVALIHDNSGIAKRTIEVVIANLENFEGNWLKPKAKKSAQ
jgi:hypothetical protein